MKKRLFALLLTAALLFTLLPQTVLFASADDSGTCGENLEWSFDEATGTLTITGSGEMTNWSIYFDVPWYSYCISIQSVSLPDGLTSIGDYAFMDCTGLTAIAIPDSVTSIGDWAFAYCTGLTAITIPSGVTSIGEWAFEGCSGLTSITIPSGVASIGSSAFSECSGLTSITVAEGNPVYDSRNNCNAIIEAATNTLIAGCKNTVIPDSVTSIGDCAFVHCTGLTAITIPDSVTSIGWGAFEDCTGLTAIAIPDSVTSIGNYAFYGCTGLTAIAIPDSVTSIGMGAFEYCTGLTSVTIGNGVTSIGDWAFYHCTGLTAIAIPDSVTSIGDDAFYDCTGLTDVYYPGTEEEWNAIYIDGGNDPLANATIHFGQTEADPIETDSGTCGENLEWSFEEATGTLTITGSGAMDNWDWSPGVPWYSYCGSIRSVSLPDGLTSIGNYAFEDCTGLTAVSIPDSVTSIGYRAFYNCTGLTTITIPDSVTSIGNFAFSGCTGLTSITVAEGNPVYDSRNNCNAIIETATNTLIAGCKNTVIPDSVTSIGDQAFVDCTGLTNITIPDSVTSIGNSAFWNCTGLTAIAIPDSVTSIGDQAFFYCTGLASITIPDSVTSIGWSAFEGCTGLTAIAIPDSVTSIGDLAFYHCTGLTAIAIPDSVTSIGSSAFYRCTGLSHVHFLGSKPSIGAYAFSSCASDLTLCYLPETTGWENYTDYPAEEWDCTVTADCTSITYTCNTCGEAYTVIGEYHDWSLTETITAPTCTQAGSGVYACAACGTTKTEPIPATGHRQGDLVSETETYWEYQCLNGDHTYTVYKDARLQAMSVCGIEVSFSDSGSYPWVFSENNSTVGANAIISSNQGVNSSTSSTTVSFTAAAEFTLSFDYRVSSESYYDELTVKVDGTTVANAISGTSGSSYSATLPAGTHTLTLSYSKDGSVNNGTDTGYIYNIVARAETACTHSWDDGTATTAATCTQAGVMTYTCTLCGETRTEQTEPLGHSFVNGVCETCGEKLKIFSASLRLDENLNLVYAVQLPENIEDPHMVFTFLGTEITVTDYTVNADGRYCFELADINPQCMGDTISATLYATYDGTEYTDTIAEYSVCDYCVNMLAKTNDDLFVTLLSDILTYGAAAQTYTNYKTDALVTDGLDLTPSTFPELSGLTEEFAGMADPDTFWKSASLTLRNNVDMNLFFCTDNVEGLSVVLEINGRTETVTDFTPVDGEENLYQITFHGILATEFDLPVSASFYRNGARVGNTLSYSVNTYICSKQHDGDVALAAMVQALYNYGATANTYFFERYLVQ